MDHNPDNCPHCSSRRASDEHYEHQQDVAAQVLGVGKYSKTDVSNRIRHESELSAEAGIEPSESSLARWFFGT